VNCCEVTPTDSNANDYSESMRSDIIYSETRTPWFLPIVLFLPCFNKYGIIIKKDENQNSTITFGYGFTGPGGFTAHTSSLEDIDPSSILIGEASGKENLIQFGGWGIRYGLISGTWAYNATFSGPYCEFVEKVGSRSTKYRFVCENAETVASLLRGGESQDKFEN
jgi:hypothetical protein